MNEELKEILKDRARRYGVTLEVGGENKEVVEFLKQLAKDRRGRLDIVQTKKTPTSLTKKGNYNVYNGAALYWSSSIVNLEYDIVYLEPEANLESENFVQLLHEYWPIVRPGGIICGKIERTDDLTKAYKDKFEMKDGYWFRFK